MLVLDVPYFPIEQKPLSVRLIEFAIQLVTIYPTAAIVVKRLHDRNQPGYLCGLASRADHAHRD